jgi:hypothetical protein
MSSFFATPFFSNASSHASSSSCDKQHLRDMTRIVARVVPNTPELGWLSRLLKLAIQIRHLENQLSTLTWLYSHCASHFNAVYEHQIEGHIRHRAKCIQQSASLFQRSPIYSKEEYVYYTQGFFPLIPFQPAPIPVPVPIPAAALFVVPIKQTCKSKRRDSGSSDSSSKSSKQQMKRMITTRQEGDAIHLLCKKKRIAYSFPNAQVQQVQPVQPFNTETNVLMFSPTIETEIDLEPDLEPDLPPEQLVEMAYEWEEEAKETTYTKEEINELGLPTVQLTDDIFTSTMYELLLQYKLSNPSIPPHDLFRKNNTLMLQVYKRLKQKLHLPGVTFSHMMEWLVDRQQAYQEVPKESQPRNFYKLMDLLERCKYQATTTVSVCQKRE